MHNTIEHRKSLAREVRNLLEQNPGRLWSTTHQQIYDTKLAEMSQLDDDARRFRQVTELEESISIAELSNAGITNTFLRKGLKGLSEMQCLRIANTMGTQTGSQGGYSVPSDVNAQLIDALKDYSGIRRVADVIKTEKGEPLPYPTSDGTSEVGELLSENATAAALDPSFGTVPLPVYRYSSKIFTVPFELLYMSGTNMTQFIFDRAAARIGRISNTHFTTGTGSGQPQGIVGVASSGKVGTTGQTLTVIHDDIVDLIHSVNAAYRYDPKGSAGFMMSDAAFKIVRKLKDSQSRPIYAPDDIETEQLMGYPVWINDDIPVMAANAKSILFGNFKAYKVRDALDVTMFRFDDSMYTRLGQVGFLAWTRSGGNLADVNAVKYYQNSAT